MVPQAPTPGNTALQQTVRAPNGASAQAHADVAGALADLLAADVDEWPGRGFDVVKRRTVRRVLRGSLGDVPVHVKVFRADTIAAKADAPKPEAAEKPAEAAAPGPGADGRPAPRAAEALRRGKRRGPAADRNQRRARGAGTRR